MHRVLTTLEEQLCTRLCSWCSVQQLHCVQESGSMQVMGFVAQRLQCTCVVTRHGESIMMHTETGTSTFLDDANDDTYLRLTSTLVDEDM